MFSLNVFFIIYLILITKMLKIVKNFRTLINKLDQQINLKKTFLTGYVFRSKTR